MPNDLLPMNQRSRRPRADAVDVAPASPRPIAKPKPLPPLVPVQAPVPVPPPIPPKAEEPKVIPAAVPSHEASSEEIPTEIQGKDLLIHLEPRRYRVRGWDKPLSPEVLKVNLQVSRDDRFHVDTLDLYQAKARTAFVRQASVELGASEDAIKRDLGKVLRTVEKVQAGALEDALKKKDQRPAMSESEQADALALLKSPDLMDCILQDFQGLGVVGEESNKLTAYLAGVSRLLDRPLAMLIQSASAAGKTSLMDAVLNLMPPEDLVRYSAMSSQSLFYMGTRSLRNKVLAIAEEEGAKQASYALKLLQSEGKVTMASTGKDASTGMLTAHEYTVEGPVSLFLTTTSIDLDEELLNRCLVLTVNESREQTRAIHGVQRQRETLEGLLEHSSRSRVVNLHRNLQRLLQPLAVVNPYADRLSFRDDQTRSRRDHVKYLTLIRTIALLHQFQREIKAVEHQGQTLHYIEVTPLDIEIANRLAQEVFSRTVDELLPQTRKLLTQVHGWVTSSCERMGIAQADFRFTRKEVREALGWGDTQLRIHLDRLVEMEYLLAHRGKQGQRYAYELVFQGEDADGRARLLGLIDAGKLQPGSETSRGSEPNFAGCLRGECGALSGGMSPEETLVG